MNYYIILNGQQLGPFPENELLSHCVTPSTPVWTEGMPDWKNAGEVPALAYLFNYTHQAAAPVPPYQQQAQPAPNYSTPTMPKTWLVESILVTLFCCLPFGIVGIIKASNVSTFFAAGKYDEAEQASKDARRWTLIGFFSCLVAIVLYILLIVIIALTGGNIPLAY